MGSDRCLQKVAGGPPHACPTSRSYALNSLNSFFDALLTDAFDLLRPAASLLLLSTVFTSCLQVTTVVASYARFSLNAPERSCRRAQSGPPAAASGLHASRPRLPAQPVSLDSNTIYPTRGGRPQRPRRFDSTAARGPSPIPPIILTCRRRAPGASEEARGAFVLPFYPPFKASSHGADVECRQASRGRGNEPVPGVLERGFVGRR